MILAATGLQREARIVGDAGVTAIAGGGDHAKLEARLEALAPKAKAIASIGIAGGLASALQVGRWVVADCVIVDGESIQTDKSWTACIAGRVGGITRGALLGRNTMVTTAAEKTALHRATGALAVDMESHLAGRVARRHHLPFVALRVVCDPAGRSLPPAAHVGMKPDGGMDLAAVLRSLLAQPGQLPALIGVALDAERAFKSLVRGHRRLGPRLGFPDLDQLALDVP
jgi:hopanoid-associated phosphorylase